MILFTCEQALHLENIVTFSRGLHRSPKQESLLAGYNIVNFQHSHSYMESIHYVEQEEELIFLLTTRYNNVFRPHHKLSLQLYKNVGTQVCILIIFFTSKLFLIRKKIVLVD